MELDYSLIESHNLTKLKVPQKNLPLKIKMKFQVLSFSSVFSEVDCSMLSDKFGSETNQHIMASFKMEASMESDSTFL